MKEEIEIKVSDQGITASKGKGLGFLQIDQENKEAASKDLNVGSDSDNNK